MIHENFDTLLETIDTNGLAPEQEPFRQYYFIKKCREIISRLEKEKERKLTACVVTFGCQMNSRDSEKITGILSETGFTITEDEEADFIIYNTCTIRENANQKVYGHLGYLKSKKKQNPERLIALCGCMMQEKEVVEKIRQSYGFVDLIFGTHNIFKFPELLYGVLRNQGQKKHKLFIDIWEDTNQIVEELPEERKYFFKAGVNIMFGCNNFCSYCIVPYVRGRERSRKPEDILKEIKTLADQGVVEIMLLGQNVNSYGKTLETPMTFARLLQEVEKIDGIKRIRFMTSHPKDLSDELIEVMKNSRKICRQLHLPLQSGSSRILEKMNRRYDKEHYLSLVEKIRTAIPDIALSTDIIVGFPGETEEDFLETLDVVRKASYDSAFTFQYSKRTGTPAAAMEQVPGEVVTERFNRLLALVQEMSAKEAGKDLGKVVEVLVEEKNKQEDSYVTGRMSNSRLVHFKGDESLIGRLVNVRLTENCNFYYVGELCESK